MVPGVRDVRGDGGVFGPHIYEWHVSKRQRWPLCQDLASEMGVLILLGVFELLVYWHIGVVRLEMASARRAAKAFMMAMGAGMVVGLSVSLFASDEHSATWEMLFADTIAVFAVLAYAMGLGLDGSVQIETWGVPHGEGGTTASTAGEGTTEG